jgi:hypothetical protein
MVGVMIGSGGGGRAKVECQEGGRRGMSCLAEAVVCSFFFLIQMLRFYYHSFLHKFIKPQFIRENFHVEVKYWFYRWLFFIKHRICKIMFCLAQFISYSLTCHPSFLHFFQITWHLLFSIHLYIYLSSIFYTYHLLHASLIQVLALRTQVNWDRGE